MLSENFYTLRFIRLAKRRRRLLGDSGSRKGNFNLTNSNTGYRVIETKYSLIN